MMIWADEVALPWSDEETAELRAAGAFEASLASVRRRHPNPAPPAPRRHTSLTCSRPPQPMPAGAHFRPYPGSPSSLLMLWEALHADIGVEVTLP